MAAASDELPSLASVWHDQRSELGDDRALAQFNERLAREWAIETGVIERVYSLDRGVTQVLIEHGIDVALIPHDATDQPPELVAEMIGDHRLAVEWLFEFVASRRGLTVSFVKELHALMTRHQAVVVGVDQFGRQTEVPLLHGEYKKLPNNPTRPDGSVHEYCPPAHVASEMDRLIDLHAQHTERGVPPEVEAAWLHHRFTQIHPFQDGNGRIARALASLVFLRHGWFPLVITRDERARYIDALEAADHGRLAPLVDLFAARQKKAFVSALGIAKEVVQETERVDQVLVSIGDMFAKRDEARLQELESAKQLAERMRDVAHHRFEEISGQLGPQLGGSPERRTWADTAAPDDDRRMWHRAQILDAVHAYGYFAGFRDFASWARLCIQTENGRGEIVVAFHSVGHEYRGVVGAVMVFFRRGETEDGQHLPLDVTVIGDDPFQINYKDTDETARSRFTHWLERGLVEALDLWRRSE
jgi:hypothetical protein